MSTILFIDDDERGMKPYRLALTDDGFVVLTAKDPDEAVAALVGNRPQIRLIILDVLMPSGELLKDENVDHGLTTGIHLLSYIKEAYPEVPIVVFSVTNSDALQSDGPPPVDVLRKVDTMPLELVELVKDRVGAGWDCR